MAVVWVIGSLNIDLVSRVQRLPSPGETVSGTNLERFPGGKGANQAVAAAAAGATVRMIGRVGDDADGARYVTALSQRSIDVSGVTVEPGCVSGHAIVLVGDDAQNCIVVTPGANGLVDHGDVARFLPAAGDVVLLQLEVPTEVIAEAVAVASGARAISLLNLAPFRDIDPKLISACDVVLVNEYEARQLEATGTTPKSLVITRGPDGATWGDHSAAMPADDVVDTTGAGDAFAGALAAALAAGADHRTALERAVLAGAHAVGRRGAQGWQF